MILFIYKVADEIRCLSKRHFVTVMLESGLVYSPVPFPKALSNTHRDYYQGILISIRSLSLNIANKDRCSDVTGENGQYVLYRQAIYLSCI